MSNYTDHKQAPSHASAVAEIAAACSAELGSVTAPLGFALRGAMATRRTPAVATGLTNAIFGKDHPPRGIPL